MQQPFVGVHSIALSLPRGPHVSWIRFTNTATPPRLDIVTALRCWFRAFVFRVCYPQSTHGAALAARRRSRPSFVGISSHARLPWCLPPLPPVILSKPGRV